MDALEFIRERNRMCRTFDKSCDGCPASVSSAYRDANGNCKVRRLKCADCRKEFWSQEV